jgi:hypothetical protein
MVKLNLQNKQQVDAIKKTLMSIDNMRPGTLTKQYIRRNQKQYAYYQLSYTHKMKSRTRYISPASIKTVKKEIKAYKLFKKLIQQWIDISIQASDDRLKAIPRKSNKRK